jgi:hypothetical protein
VAGTAITRTVVLRHLDRSGAPRLRKEVGRKPDVDRFRRAEVLKHLPLRAQDLDEHQSIRAGERIECEALSTVPGVDRLPGDLTHACSGLTVEIPAQQDEDRHVRGTDPERRDRHCRERDLEPDRHR